MLLTPLKRVVLIRKQVLRAFVLKVGIGFQTKIKVKNKELERSVEDLSETKTALERSTEPSKGKTALEL